MCFLIVLIIDYCWRSWTGVVLQGVTPSVAAPGVTHPSDVTVLYLIDVRQF